MTRQDDYDYITDYGGRRPVGDPTGLVIIGVIYGLFQLICWLCGQFWFWTVLLPIIVVPPIVAWCKTHDRQKTFLVGFMAVCLSVLLGMLFVSYTS